jgi:hypothetical protein
MPGGRGFSFDASAATDIPDLVIAPALTYQQFRACSALVRRMYTWRGYVPPAARQHLDDPNHVTLGAWIDGDPVATLTLSRDSDSGLLADTLYAHEMASLRKSAHMICEVTRLAVDTEYQNTESLHVLVQAAYQYAGRVFKGSDAVIEVNPRHAGYYRREHGFKQVGTLRTCPRVNAPAVLLHRPLGNLHI